MDRADTTKIPIRTSWKLAFEKTTPRSFHSKSDARTSSSTCCKIALRMFGCTIPSTVIFFSGINTSQRRLLDKRHGVFTTRNKRQRHRDFFVIDLFIALIKNIAFTTFHQTFSSKRIDSSTNSSFL